MTLAGACGASPDDAPPAAHAGSLGAGSGGVSGSVGNLPSNGGTAAGSGATAPGGAATASGGAVTSGAPGTGTAGSSGGGAAGATSTGGGERGGGDTGGAIGSGGTAGSPALATIYFSNDGLLAGWDSAKPQSNTIGRVAEVMEPTFKTSTAILTEQTYVKPQGAHSEVVLATAQRNDEDRYYGQAIYLPLDWDTIDKNATFQQFSPETPAGPWNLNWIQNDHIFIRVAGTHYDCGPIKKGVWTRVVVRFKTSNPGIFEYWVDGDKKWSVTDKNLTIPNGSPTMRWSVGIYVTWWRDQDPGAQLTRQIYHDQLRVTSSYASADPANWGP